jgi:hypothetical protein
MNRGIFTPETIKAGVEQSIAEAGIPSNHHTAVVVALTTDGIKGAFATRIGDHWTVNLGAEVSRPDGFKGGIVVTGSW